MNKKAIVIAILLLIPFFGMSQTVTWGGNIDFEYRQGGEDSRAGLNWTPTSNPTIYTPFVRLWAGIDFSDQLWADVTLQSDYYEGPSPSPIFVSMIQLNYQPWEDRNFTISAGKFVIPFGLEQDRFLNVDNPFANYSLLHQWNLHLDKTTGYYGLGQSANYGGMALVYGRRYTQGLRLHGSAGTERLFTYDLALTTAAASSFFAYAKNQKPAFIGRVSYKPLIWMKLGASGTYGPYMDAMASTRNEDRTQFAYSSDLNLNYGYLEFNVQYTHSQWDSYTLPSNYNSAPGGIENYNLVADHGMAEMIVNLPFYPGSWVAARYETMSFSEHSFPFYGNTPISWMRNMERFEAVIGKKLTRNSVLKTSFMNGFNAGPIEWDDWVFTVQVSTVF